MAIERLSVTAQGHIQYALKTPYRDGTVFAPNHRFRALIVPGKLGMFSCRNAQLVSTINAGVDTQVSVDLPAGQEVTPMELVLGGWW